MSPASGSSVMIVEDDEEIRLALSEVLTEHGYMAITAANGAEALAALESVKPGLILLDLNMPVMDGFEFRRQQRSDPRAAHIPTFVMSALHQLGERSADLGVEGTLEKPVSLERLLEVVESYCG